MNDESEIEGLAEKLGIGLRDLAIAFNHGTHPAPHGRGIYSIRDSIKHRMGGVSFQLSILREITSSAAGVILDAPKEWRPILADHVLRTSLTFDNLVFNLMSLCDYVAGGVSYIVHFDTPNALQSAQKVAWRDLLPMARNRAIRKGGASTNRLAGTYLGDAILAADTDVVDGLREYRNDLIHNGSDPTTGSVTLSYGERFADGSLGLSAAEPEVEVPKKFTAHFPTAGQMSDVLAAAHWLTRSVYSNQFSIVGMLMKHVKAVHTPSMACLTQDEKDT